MRQQAAREINWHTPHRLSFDDDVPLLSVINEFGLQPSVAPLEEPNVDFRWTGRANIHETSPRHGH